MTVHELLHACWGQAKRSPDYDKQTWTELQAALGELQRRGLAVPPMDGSTARREVRR